MISAPWGRRWRGLLRREEATAFAGGTRPGPEGSNLTPDVGVHGSTEGGTVRGCSYGCQPHH